MLKAKCFIFFSRRYIRESVKEEINHKKIHTLFSYSVPVYTAALNDSAGKNVSILWIFAMVND